MKKTKKWLLGIGSIASVAVPIATVVSCGTDGYGDNWKYASHRDVHEYLTSSDGTSPWYGVPAKEIAPRAWINQTILGESWNSELVGMFRKQKLGFDKFETVTSKDKIPTTTIKATPNRATVLKFELVNKVTFQFKAGDAPTVDSENDGSATTVKDIVFDSDSSDENDDKSINGTHFQEILAASKFVRVQFQMNPEARKHHWIEQKTGKKGSTFRAEDFWTGMAYDNADSSYTRYNTGGSESLDQFANVGSKVDNDLFSAPEPTSPPAFLVGNQITLGILKDQFKSENKANVIPDQNTINLNFTGRAGGNKIKSWWNTNFRDAGGFKAMSTDEVQAAIKKIQFPNELATPEFLNSETYKSGIYQMNMFDAPPHYIGGQYYIGESSKQKVTMQLNEDYVNQAFINEKNSKGQRTHLNSYTTDFIQESDLATTIEAQGFKQGFIALTPTDGFSKSDLLKAKEAMAKNDKSYGLSFSTGYTSSHALGDYTVQQLYPFLSAAPVLDETGKLVPNPKKGKVWYNDGYAKVMWGHTLSELREGKDAPGSVAKTLFDGSGLEFRTALQAALNTYTAVTEYDPGFQEWTSWFAPEGPIPNHIAGKTGDPFYPAHLNLVDETDSSLDSIREALRRITSKFSDTVNADGSITAEEHTRQSYVDAYTSQTKNALDKYAAAKINSIKTLIKKSLDDAGIAEDEEVLWEFTYGRGMNAPDLNVVYENMRKLINSLDPRLHLAAKLEAGTEDGTIKAKVDVEEIGTDFVMEAPGNSQDKYWLQRLFAYGQGGNAGSLKVGQDYVVNTPASPMVYLSGYLQTGVIQGLSYFSANPTLMTDANHLNGLKPIINAFTTALASDKKMWDSELAGLHGTDIDKIKTALQNFTFNDIADSKASEISDYDYVGFKGLDDIREMVKTNPDASNAATDLGKAVSIVNDLINSWITDALYELDSWMSDEKTDTVDIMNSMTAYQMIAPWSLNPLDAKLGNRTYPSLNFKKNWFYEGADAQAMYSFGYYRVDLDVEGDK